MIKNLKIKKIISQKPNLLVPLYKYNYTELKYFTILKSDNQQKCMLPIASC